MTEFEKLEWMEEIIKNFKNHDHNSMANNISLINSEKALDAFDAISKDIILFVGNNIFDETDIEEYYKRMKNIVQATLFLYIAAYRYFCDHYEYKKIINERAEKAKKDK